jgi:hypothetical protein
MVDGLVLLRRTYTGLWFDRYDVLQALQQCGTEFSVMETFFPHRARKELKMKFFRCVPFHNISCTHFRGTRLLHWTCWWHRVICISPATREESQHPELIKRALDSSVPLGKRQVLCPLGLHTC